MAEFDEEYGPLFPPGAGGGDTHVRYSRRYLFEQGDGAETGGAASEPGVPLVWRALEGRGVYAASRSHGPRTLLRSAPPSHTFSPEALVH